MIKCPVCSAKMEQLFIAKVLYKYNVKYYQCMQCGLLKTEKPFWVEEAYDSVIANLDVGLVQRNIYLSELVRKVLRTYFEPCGKFLDYAGGYGLFVRLMRDKGFDFQRHDKYCENIFSKYFDVPILDREAGRFELVTAFEVLEHIVDPVSELGKLFEVTDSVLFTTELLPPDVVSVEDWWYFVPETGQHITFYTEVSLRNIADKLSVNYYGDGKKCHLLTRNNLTDFSFSFPEQTSIVEAVRRVLLRRPFLSRNKPKKNGQVSLQRDFEFIKMKLGKD